MISSLHNITHPSDTEEINPAKAACTWLPTWRGNKQKRSHMQSSHLKDAFVNAQLHILSRVTSEGSVGECYNNNDNNNNHRKYPGDH